MSLPVFVRLYKPSNSHFTCLALWLNVVVTLQGCAGVATPEPQTSQNTVTEYWQEVRVRKPSPVQYSEHCEVSVNPSVCELFAKIAADVRFRPASPELEPQALLSLEQTVQPLLDDQLRLAVTTYIDDTGDELLDMLLAKRRTLTIIRFLSHRGVPLKWLRPREPVLPADDETIVARTFAHPEVEMRVLKE